MPYNGLFLHARRAAGVRLAPFRPFRMHRSAKPLRTLRYALYGFLYFFALLRKVRQMKPALLLICRNTVLALPVYMAARLCHVPTAIVLADLLSFLLEQADAAHRCGSACCDRSSAPCLAALHDRIFVVTPAMADEITMHVGEEVRSKICVTRDGIQERFLALVVMRILACGQGNPQLNLRRGTAGSVLRDTRAASWNARNYSDRGFFIAWNNV